MKFERWTRRAGRGLAAIVLAAVTGIAGSVVAADTAAAAPSGCGYADSSPSNGKYASTICWFDFSGFDMAQARSAGGQAMQVTLDGGYVASFTIRFADVPGTATMSVERRSTPLETRFSFGSDAYRGVPGLHTLYSLPSPGGDKGGVLSFENITIVDSLGAAVSGFSFVAADTEDNVSGESFAWSSDKPLNEIERLAPAGSWGCKTPVGLGTTSVSCAGTGVGGTTIAGGKSTALLIAANSPTRFSTQWITFARSGIAIGIQTAKLTIVKQVTSRINSADSFDVAVAALSGTVLASGTTGTGNTASTGVVTVLAGATFTLAESPTTGSPTALSNYANSWSCTNANPSSPTPLPTGGGTSKAVTPLPGDDITCTVTNSAKAVSIALQKVAGTPNDVNGDGLSDAGDTIPYSFTVTNTGALGIQDVTVTDPKLGTVTCPPGSVAPGATLACSAAAQYTVTAADDTFGAVVNTATATATVVGATATVTSAAATTSTPVAAPAPGLTIVKSATPSAPAAYVPGQPIVYSFVVTNSGNVIVSNIQVTDTAFSGTGSLGAINCPIGSDTLAPGEQATCTASYALTLADVTSGSVTNTAAATGDPVGGGGTVSAAPSSFALPVSPAPSVSLVKSATPATASMPGDAISYEFAVTNTGNVPLSAASVTETAFSGTGAAPAPTCPTGTFVPGETMICTASYTLTQVDVDAGILTNAATSTATAAAGPDPQSATSSATVTIPSSASLGLTKSAAMTGAGVAGDVVTYSFLVVNSGNVTVSALAIDESAFSGSGSLGAASCPVSTLAAGESVTCTAQYSLTQADVDAGQVDNTATATGDPAGPAAAVSSRQSSVSVAASRTAAIDMVKSVNSSSVKAGTALIYSFAVRNSGTVSLAAVTITETAFTGSGPQPQVICPPGTLAPGDNMTCTASYTVTQPDSQAGFLSNTAIAAATAPAGVAAAVSAPSRVSIGSPKAIVDPLAFTGGTIAWAVVPLGLSMVYVGALLVIVNRRVRRRSS